MYDRFIFALGEGLVTSSGSKWQAHRHMINPSFHSELLKEMVAIFNHHTFEMLLKWKSLDRFDHSRQSIRVDLNRELCSLTLGIIGDAGFGYKFSNSNTTDQLFKSVYGLLDEMNHRMTDLTNHSHLLFPQRTRNTNLSLEVTNSMIDDVIDQRIRERSESSSSPSPPLPRPPRDLLDMLLDAQARDEEDHLQPSDNQAQKELIQTRTFRFTHRDLRDHCKTFLGAGHETTSSTLLWACLELSRHPEEQDLCHKEIDSLFSSKRVNQDLESLTPLTLEDLSLLPYLTQVIKETLRLHPSVPSFAKSNSQPTSFGQYLLPPRSTIIVSVAAIHRHPDYWEHPLEFMPSRFDPERRKETLKHPFQYIPFSAGPRNCIGQRFAMLELTVVLAHLLHRYCISVLPSDEQQLTYEETITYQPRNFFCVFEPRY